MDTVLEVSHLVKRYGTYTAVDDISFSVPRGKIIGFLGPNGAGKTTTIQMLIGITLADGGKISYFGKDYQTHKTSILQRMNFTSSFNNLQNRLTAYQNLLVFANLYSLPDPKKKIKELSDYFSLDPFMDTQYMNLSAGQKTRVNIVKSLLNDPELVLMDEPTASLDPDVADKTLSLIEELNKTKGLSILYTSHEMDEVTRICDEVIFLNKGKIVAQDTPLGLTKQFKSVELILTADAPRKELMEFLEKRKLLYTFLNAHSFSLQTTEKDIPQIIYDMTHIGISLTDIDVKKPTLEDFFLQLARGENNEK